MRQLLWHRHRLVQMRTRIMNPAIALVHGQGLQLVVDAEVKEANQTAPGSARRSVVEKEFDRADTVRDVR